jgi:hypothetical protein
VLLLYIIKGILLLLVVLLTLGSNSEGCRRQHTKGETLKEAIIIEKKKVACIS